MMKIEKVESVLVEDTHLKQEIPGVPLDAFRASYAHFSNDFYNGFLAPLLPMLVAKLNISLALAGSLVSILSVFNSLLQPVAGLIADRLRKPYLIVFSCVITGLFMSLIGIVNSYWTLALILALSGIGTSLFHPQGASFVGRLPARRPGFSLSVFSMGGSLGVAVGPLVVVPLVNRFGLAATPITIVVALFSLVFTLPLLRHRLPVHPQHRKLLLKNLHGYGTVVFLLFAIVVMRATMIITFSNFTPLYLNSLGKPLFLGATAVTIFSAFGTAGILAGGYLSDRLKPETILYLSFALTLPFAVLFFQFPATWSLPFLGLAAFFLFSSTPVNILIGQRLLPENASFISGIMMGFAWGFGGILATPFGALADHIGLYATLLIIAGLSLMGIFLVYLCICEGGKSTFGVAPKQG